MTKQLQQDGTSKMMIYKPVINETPKYITNDDLNNELSNMKQQIEELKNKLLKIEGVGSDDESKTNGN